MNIPLWETITGFFNWNYILFIYTSYKCAVDNTKIKIHKGCWKLIPAGISFQQPCVATYVLSDVTKYLEFTV